MVLGQAHLLLSSVLEYVPVPLFPYYLIISSNFTLMMDKHISVCLIPAPPRPQQERKNKMLRKEMEMLWNKVCLQGSLERIVVQTMMQKASLSYGPCPHFFHVPTYTHASFQFILCTAAKVIFLKQSNHSVLLMKTLYRCSLLWHYPALAYLSSLLSQKSFPPTLASLWFLKYAKAFPISRLLFLLYPWPIMVFSQGWLILTLQVSV